MGGVEIGGPLEPPYDKETHEVLLSQQEKLDAGQMLGPLATEKLLTADDWAYQGWEDDGGPALPEA